MTLEFLLSTITPIHIGSGEVINPLEYYYNESEKKIHILSIEKLLDALEKEFGQEEAIRKIDSLTREIEEQVDKTKLNHSLVDFLKDLSIDPKLAVSRSIDSISLARKTVQINEFIRTSKGYYIPGSSLKGAIRTAFLFNRLKKTGLTVTDDYNLPRRKEWAAQDLEREVFGRSPFEDLFKILTISDSNAIKEEFINVTKIDKFNIIINETVLELFMQTCFIKDLQSNKTDSPRFAVNYKKKYHRYLEKTEKFEDLIDEIGNAANVFTTAIIDHETNVVKNRELLDFYTTLNKRIKNYTDNRQFILPLGYGTGFLSKTMALMLDEYQLRRIRRRYRIGQIDSPIFPSQRTLVTLMSQDYIRLPVPIGWVEITVKA